MWVVKIGGSMNHDPLLPQWLDLLSQLGGGRVTVVCGGGSFADEVRREQARWHVDDLAALILTWFGVTKRKARAMVSRPIPPND